MKFIKLFGQLVQYFVRHETLLLDWIQSPRSEILQIESELNLEYGFGILDSDSGFDSGFTPDWTSSSFLSNCQRDLN